MRRSTRYLVVGGVAVVLHGHTVFSFWSSQFPATEVDIFVEEPFDFGEAYSRATQVKLGENVIIVASIRDLVDLKRAAGRAKDLEDVRQLEAIAERLERKP